MTGSENWQQMRQKLAPEEVLHPQAVELRRLGLILLVALIHGLIYLFLVPPWQHYDEPNHFEYVWMVAHRYAEWERLPQPGDVHGRLSYRVIESMHKYGFYDGAPVPPELPAPTRTLKIPGYTELTEPPLYYLLASLPARLFRPMVLVRQLYAIRAVSLLLYLLTIIAGWGAARELSLPGHPLRWLLPVALALLPGLADLMTAVNSDALAIAVFSFFFWGSLRWMMRGPELLTFFWIVLSAGLTVYVKNSAMVALLLLPLVLVFGVLRGRWRPLAWALLAGGLIAGAAYALMADDAAGWYRVAPQAEGLRQPVAKLAPVAGPSPAAGNYALALDAPVESFGRKLAVYQMIPPGVARPAFNRTVTFGVWMWAEHPGEAGAPRLIAAGKSFSESVSLTSTPQFFAYQVDLPPGSDRIWIFLPPTPAQAGRVVYDGAVLAVGAFPVDTPPQFSDSLGQSGVWGGQPFENLIRNPSFERTGLRIRPRLDDVIARYLPDNARPSQLLASFLDPAGTWYFYRPTLRHLFQTFWARFGWGHVPLIWDWAYLLPGLISVLALIGCLVGALRVESLPGDVAVLTVLALIVSISLAFVRGAAYLEYSIYYYAPARHFYPVVVPAMLVVTAGWLGLTGSRRRLALLLPALMLVLAVLSVYSVAVFYGRLG